MTKEEREWVMWAYGTFVSPEGKQIWGEDYIKGFSDAIRLILGNLKEDKDGGGEHWNGKMKVTIHEKTFDEEVVEADKISLNDWRIKLENRGKEPIFYGMQAISYIEITKKGD